MYTAVPAVYSAGVRCILGTCRVPCRVPAGTSYTGLTAILDIFKATPQKASLLTIGQTESEADRPRTSLDGLWHPASGLQTLNSVDRELIVASPLKTDSSLIYGPMGQIGGLPLVAGLDVSRDESRDESRRVIIDRGPAEAKGRSRAAGAALPWREGLFSSARHTAVRCAGVLHAVRQVYPGSVPG